MKIEWLLHDLDNSARAYSDLSKQLQFLPANSPNYEELEREVHKQIRQLKLDVQHTLETIERPDN